MRALADAEGITVDDEDLVAEIERLASQTGQSARDLASRLAGSSGLEQLRSDVRNEKAVAWLTDFVDLVDEQGAPMDRTLLLEAPGSDEDSAAAAEPEADRDGDIEDAQVTDVEDVDVTDVEVERS